MAVVNVIIVHGMGDPLAPDKPYSEPLQNHIREYCQLDERQLRFWEVNYSRIGDAEERDLIRNKHVLPDATMPGAETLWPPQDAVGEALDDAFNVSEQLRRFLFTHIGDVLIYLTQRGGEQIRQRLLDTITAVRRDVYDQPTRDGMHYVSIVAYSLGTVVAYDVCALLGTRLRAEVQGLGLSHLFTLGSPLALFSLLNYGGEVAHYPKRGVRLDRRDGSSDWLNFYDQQDPLAFPLRYVYPPQPHIPGRNYAIQDIRVQTGTFHAHTRYFDNKTIAQEIAARLLADYRNDR